MGEKLRGNGGKEVPGTVREQRSEPRATGDEKHPLSETKVLVVEDMLSVRLTLSNMMKMLGADVAVASTGSAALELLFNSTGVNGSIGLILLDLRLKDMGGLEILKKVRNDSVLRDVPVIIVTAESDRNVIMQAAKHKIAAYILKPFKTQQVIDAARRAVESIP